MVKVERETTLARNLLEDQGCGCTAAPIGCCINSAKPRRSLWRMATFETLRRAFLKIAVRIEEL